MVEKEGQKHLPDCELKAALTEDVWTFEDVETLRGYISGRCDVYRYDELTPEEHEVIRSRYGRSDYQPDHRFVYRQRDLTLAQADFVHGFDLGDYRDLRVPEGEL